MPLTSQRADVPVTIDRSKCNDGCTLCVDKNLRGALNTIVTKPGSAPRSLSDLCGEIVSSSVGSASDGTLVRAVQRAGIDPEQGVHKLHRPRRDRAGRLRRSTPRCRQEVHRRATGRDALATTGCPAPYDATAVAALGARAWQVRAGAARAPAAAGPGVAVPAPGSPRRGDTRSGRPGWPGARPG